MQGKKEARWESKKRKIEAFLRVAKMNDIDKEDGVTPTMEQPKTKSQDHPRLPPEELAKLKAELRARQKAKMKLPKLYLTLPEWVEYESCGTEKEFDPKYVVQPKQKTLFVLDLQHLVLNAVQNQFASWKPRWCKLIRPSTIDRVVTIIVDGLSIEDFQSRADSMPFTANMFQMKVEMVSPSQYGKSVFDELFNVPVSRTKTKLANRFPANRKERNEELDKSAETKAQNNGSTAELVGRDGCFSRVDLLLNPQQLIEEDYPFPLNLPRYKDYKYTSASYAEVNAQSPLYAMDCEMCITSINKPELTRISIVNEELEVLYDELVRPHNNITDYLTRYSGITKAMMKGVKTRLVDVQRAIQDILPADAIVCGQSLNGDLNAVKMFHPYVIDTSVIYNLTGQRHIKSGLKRLTYQFLGRDIQTGKKGHSSVEDSIATMELVQLKLQNGAAFGDIVNGGMIFPTETTTPSSSPPPPPEPPVETPPSVINNTPSSSNVDSSPGAALNLADNKSVAVGQKRKLNIDTSSDDSDESENSNKKLKVDTENLPVKVDERKKKFFTMPECREYDCLFANCTEHEKTAALIGRQSALTPFSSRPVECVAVTNDKEACKRACELLKSHRVVTVQMQRFEEQFQEMLPQEEMHILLHKIDKRIKKIVSCVTEQSVVSILFSGRTTAVATHNALCCVSLV